MIKTVPFFLGSRVYEENNSDLDLAIKSVLTHGNFINGPEVQNLITQLQDYLDVKYVIPCGNGTDALTIALMALDLSPGDEVIIPAFGYVSAAEAASLLGFKPVFVDVDPLTFNLDPLKIEAAITPKSRVIIPMHIFGLSADLMSIKQIARNHDLKIIEDFAQAFGADYEGKKVGTYGDIGCTSFFPTKNLSCFGDGGAVVTNNRDIAEKLKAIANHGQKTKYKHDFVGVNSRLDTLQAAVLLSNLKTLDARLKRRKSIAAKYEAAFRHLTRFKLPNVESHTYNQYCVLFETESLRDQFKDHLNQNGIASIVYYPQALPMQPVFNDSETDINSFPIASSTCTKILALPIYPFLTDLEVEYVCRCISDFRVNGK